MYAIEEAAVDGVELGYYVPEIGSNIWFDGMCIPKTSKIRERPLCSSNICAGL